MNSCHIRLGGIIHCLVHRMAAATHCIRIETASYPAQVECVSHPRKIVVNAALYPLYRACVLLCVLSAYVVQ